MLRKTRFGGFSEEAWEYFTGFLLLLEVLIEVYRVARFVNDPVNEI